MASDGELNERHRIFCQEYILDWNGTRSYQAAYPDASYETAMANASTLLRKAKIQAYIKELQDDLEKQAGISRLMVANELKKLAFSSISKLHNTWIERAEFEDLTDDEKASIQEIDTKILKKNIGTTKKPEIVDVEYIKVKLYDKVRAIESIKKMLGYDAPEKHDHTSKGEKINNIQIEIVHTENKGNKSTA